MSQSEENSDQDVTISVTHAGITTDIYCSVNDVLARGNEVIEDISDVLKEIIEDNVENITGIKREAAPPEDSEPTKRQKKDLLHILSTIVDVIQQWVPEKKYYNRVKGRIFYLGLLSSLKSLITSDKNYEVEDIVDRLSSYWKPVTSGRKSMESYANAFMKELMTLVQECEELDELQSDVAKLMDDFKNK